MTSATGQAEPSAPPLPQPNSLGAWILAARPKTLVAGWAPIAVGTAIVVTSLEGYFFLPLRGLAALFVALAIQVGTNLINDAADHARGADSEQRLGPPRAVALGLLDGALVMRAGVACIGLAGVVGLWLASVSGWWLLIPGGIALLAGFLYTAGPKPLAYHGLGEIFVFVFFGLFATMGSAYVQAPSFVSRPFAPLSLPAGISLGLLATVILEVNNLRDAPADVIAGKRTIAVRIGERRSRVLIGVLLGGAFVVVPLAPLWVMIVGDVSVLAVVPLMLPLLSLPLAAATWRIIRAGASGRALNPVLGRVARLEGVFAALLVTGYVVAVWVARLVAQ